MLRGLFAFINFPKAFGRFIFFMKGEKFYMKKFLGIFLASVLVLALSVGSAFALSVAITGGNSIDTTNGYYRTVLSAGDSFSITFTASDYSGPVTWSMSTQDNTTSNSSGNYNAVGVSATSVYMSNTSGPTTTITGVLDSETVHCDVFVYASDSVSSLVTAPASDFVCLENAAYSDMLNGGTSVPNDSPSDEVVLPLGYVVPISSADIRADVLKMFADSEDIDVSQIKFLTAADISAAYEPTEAMRQEASDEGLQYAAKLNTITFPESGYYLLAIDFPDELQGTSISDLRLQFVETSKIDGAAGTAVFDVVNAICSGGELKSLFGESLDSVGGRALLLVMTSAGRSFTMYALKILLALLGGCNASIAPYIGMGVAGLLGLGGGFAFKKFFGKRKD